MLQLVQQFIINKILLVLTIQSNILYLNQYNLWLDISTIIALVCMYVIGVGDGHGDGYTDNGVGNVDVGGYAVGIANGDVHGMMI